MVNLNLPSGSSLMSQLALILFPLCDGLYCSIINCPLGIILVLFDATCVSIIALVAVLFIQ